MTTLLLSLLLAAAHAADAPKPAEPQAPAAPAPEKPAEEMRFAPPAPPKRDKPSLDSASELALDLARAVSFLESGQSYFRAYSKGTHTPAENKAFVRFLEDYERELAAVKKELDVLREWVEKKSGLKE